MMIGKASENIDIQIPYDAYSQDKDRPTFEAFLTIIVRNEKGEITKVHKQWSRSPTSNFIIMFLPANASITGTITNINGTSYTYNINSSPLFYPTNNINYPSYLVMIQVGSGKQSNPYTATALAAPIANGSGTGQLLYGQPSVSQTPSVSGSSVYFTISQTFNNQSGGTVTITELGIIMNLYLHNPSANANQNLGQFLMWYDVLSSSISIPNGGSLTIYYTFTVNP